MRSSWSNEFQLYAQTVYHHQSQTKPRSQKITDTYFCWICVSFSDIEFSVVQLIWETWVRVVISWESNTQHTVYKNFTIVCNFNSTRWSLTKTNAKRNASAPTAGLQLVNDRVYIRATPQRYKNINKSLRSLNEV